VGRRGDHTLEQIKEMAIDAAEKLVQKKGLDALSTRKIAAEIGYTSGTLYLVFKNLDDLLLHVNGRTLARLRDSLAKVTSQKLAPEQMVRSLCKAYLDFADENRGFWSLVYERPWPNEFKRPTWYQVLIGQCFATMHAALKSVDPSKSDAQVQESSQAIWAMIHGTHALYLSGRAEAAGVMQAPGLIEHQLDLFLKGYKVI
jgi:AcrR family transcriptional regulator